MKGTKLAYIIGSVIIGLISVLGVYLTLVATGVLSLQQRKIIVASASVEKEYDGKPLTCSEWTLLDGELKEGHVLEVKVSGTGVDAGDYVNYLTVDVIDSVGANVTSDYVIETQPGTLTINKKVLLLSSGSAKKDYDGEVLTCDEITFSDDALVRGHVLKTQMTNQISDVGIYQNEFTAEVKTIEGIDVTKNYRISYDFGTIEIAPRIIVVNTATENFVYDAGVHFNHNYTLSEKTPIVEGQTLDVKMNLFVTEVGTYKNTVEGFTVTGVLGEDLTSNYEMQEFLGDITIEPRKISVLSGSKEKDYDGIALTYENWSIVDGSLADGHELDFEFISSITYATPDGEGILNKYNVEVKEIDGGEKVTENYDITKNFGTLNIIPIGLIITSDSGTKVYDGTEFKVETYTLTGELKEGDVLDVTFTESLTNVGIKENLFTYVIKNADGEELTGAYQTSVVFSEISVTKRPITIQTGSVKSVYDGKAKNNKVYEITNGSIVDGQTETLSDWKTITDVGSTLNDFEIVIKDSSNSDVTENYEIIKALGNLVVTERPLTIKSKDLTEVYDGTEKSKKEYEIIDGSIAEYQTETLSNWATIKNVGSIDNSFDVVIKDETGTDVTKNYKLEKVLGKLTINKRHLTFESESKTFVYDGTEKFHKEYSIVEGNLAYGHTESVGYWGSIINVGSIDNDFNVTIKDADGVYVTSNYDIEKVSGNLVVTKRSITFKSESQHFTYDGIEKFHKVYDIYEGSLANGHVENVDDWSSITDVGNCENQFIIKIKDASGTDVTDNYQVQKIFGTLSVVRRSLTIRSGSKSYEYDGTEKKYEQYSIVSGSVVQGQNLSVDGFSSITDVGNVSNDFTAVIKDSTGADVTYNYQIRETLGTITITPRHIIIESGSKTFVYDGTEKSYNVINLIDGELINTHNFEINGWTKITDVGRKSNDFTVAIKDASGVNVTHNYSISRVFGDLTVTPRPIVVSTGSYSSVYDGTVKEFHSYTINSGTLVLDHYEEVVSWQGIVDAGSVDNDLVLVIKNSLGEDVTSNYEIIKNLGTLTVKKRPIAIRSATAEKVYDGTMLKGCDVNTDGYQNGYKIVSITPLVDGHFITCSVDGEILNVGSVNNTISETFIYTIIDGYEVSVTYNYDIKVTEGILTITEPNTNDNTDMGDEDDVLDENVVCAEIYSEKDGNVYLRWKSYGDYNYTINWDDTSEYSVKIDGTYSMNYLPSILLKKAGYNSYNVKLKSYIGRYMLPYYMDMEASDYRIQTSDVHYAGDTSSEYGLYVYDFDYVSQGVAGFRGVNLGTYNEMASEYENYVRSKYLNVPSDTKTELLKIINREGISSTDSNVINKVAKFIKNSATYNKDYDKTLDQSDDVAISFLNDYKEGVCSHYATAATVMFRTLGIPARYVSGFSAQAVADKWVEIKGERAHAWVEVYLSGTGWVMVEVTGSVQSDEGDVDDEENVENTKAKIAVRANSKYVKYLGNNSVVADDAIVLNENLESLLNAGYTYTVDVEGSLTEPGKSSSVVKDFCLKAPNGDVVYQYENYEKVYDNGQFEFIFYKGTLQLYLQKLEISSSSLTKVYDGTPLLPDETGWNYSGTLESGHFIDSITFIKSIINVGQISNDFIVKVVDQDGNDVSDLYYIRKNVGQLTITARSIIVTAGSAQKSYDGTELTCSTYEITSTQHPESPMVLGDELTCKTVGSITNKGRTTNEIDIDSVVILDSAGQDVTKNYSIKLVSGILRVTK